MTIWTCLSIGFMLLFGYHIFRLIVLAVCGGTVERSVIIEKKPKKEKGEEE